ncbi:HNH endonuclease [Paenarthrobacter nitroguajacolicus]
MPESRPAVPAALERRLKEEAGYRCAIPTCRQTVNLEMAHIDPWSKVKERRFENMIVLCTTCHVRYDNVKDIPRLSILQFKANLSLLSHRYTQVENQVLRHYGKIAGAGLRPADYEYGIHPGMTILFTNLQADKLFATLQPESPSDIQGLEPAMFIVPTEAGSEFVVRMVEAGNLE